MLYRVRASLHERPGALARLATRCGEAGLNILGLQIFPDLGRVTDELVISVPEDWTARAVVELVSGAGGDEVSVEPCTTHDLIDQPTRWLAAAQDVAAAPELLPTMLERLLGPHPEKWSATEHSRAEALRSLAESLSPASPLPESARRSTVEYDVTGSGVLARIGGHVVGAASFDGDAPAGLESARPARLAGADPVELSVDVAPAWRRLGIGTGLLVRAGAAASDRGISELVMVANAGDDTLVHWLSNAGFRPRLRTSGGLLQARISLTARVR